MEVWPRALLVEDDARENISPRPLFGRAQLRHV